MTPSGAARREEDDGGGVTFSFVPERRGGAGGATVTPASFVRARIGRSAAEKEGGGVREKRKDKGRRMGEVLDSGEAHLTGEPGKTAAGTEELRRAFPAAWGHSFEWDETGIRAEEEGVKRGRRGR